MSRPLVVDASVVAKVFVHEDLSANALSIIERLAAPESEEALDLYAPDFMWVECANVLWKYVTAYGYSLDDAQSDLTDLLALAITAVPCSQILRRDAFRLACTYKLPIYDACYLALAHELGCQMVTADRKLLSMVGDRLPVVFLGDWR
jgi:predicted nucleic acid-binding protein